jgi:hypothetical protein
MKRILMMVLMSLFLAGTASAAVINPIGTNSTEAPMWLIYNTIYGTGYSSNADLLPLENDSLISNGLFTEVATGGGVWWTARYADDSHELFTYDPSNPSSTNSMGVDLIGNNQIQVRSVWAPLPGDTTDIFGFLVKDTSSGEDWYSQKGLNNPNDGEYHFLVLNGLDGNLLVGVEDRTWANYTEQGYEDTDWDYNDVVFEFKNIGDPVPEPATMSLFGIGLAGMAFLRRKQKVA